MHGTALESPMKEGFFLRDIHSFDFIVRRVQEQKELKWIKSHQLWLKAILQSSYLDFGHMGLMPFIWVIYVYLVWCSGWGCYLIGVNETFVLKILSFV